MRYEIWKGREKKRSAKGGIEPLVDRVKKTWLVIYHLCHWSWCFSWLCCASSGSSCTLIDRCLVQSAVSNLFPNQWRCLNYTYSSGLSDLSLCFLTCYFVLDLVVVFSDLLFCFRICHCVFWLVIMFSGLLLCFLNCYFVFIFAFAFVICYFVFRIVICFALIGHRSCLFTTVEKLLLTIFLQCACNGRLNLKLIVHRVHLIKIMTHFIIDKLGLCAWKMSISHFRVKNFFFTEKNLHRKY